ncbi:hypothetical protein BV25DRAFT_874830 [Artomyces pyxidatus]|uniref:Uncharacterized protein n=1 Tax=Artomyces pyxidatus TaxID=48021 RepID=A0ACB8THJ1_9AGAM|nr:hypothetical protein BV25DRAFT_874830 [Artomyces pyxidatus]
MSSLRLLRRLSMDLHTQASCLVGRCRGLRTRLRTWKGAWCLGSSDQLHSHRCISLSLRRLPLRVDIVWRLLSCMATRSAGLPVVLSSVITLIAQLPDLSTPRICQLSSQDLSPLGRLIPDSDGTNNQLSEGVTAEGETRFLARSGHRGALGVVCIWVHVRVWEERRCLISLSSSRSL